MLTAQSGTKTFGCWTKTMGPLGEPTRNEKAYLYYGCLSACYADRLMPLSYMSVAIAALSYACALLVDPPYLTRAIQPIRPPSRFRRQARGSFQSCVSDAGICAFRCTSGGNRRH